MVVAGVDVGSVCTKAVLLDDDLHIISHSILRSGSLFEGAAEDSLNEALRLSGLNRGDIAYTIATGYGRIRVPFADAQITEITCHARGAHSMFPEVRTVVDIGGQDSKAISLGQEGTVSSFVMNDKCAAGTGRFLEVMAGVLDVELDEMADVAKHSTELLEISSMCTVFAETEVVSLLASGCQRADIAQGLYLAVARRITGMVGQVGLREKVVMTGGVAKNAGVVRALQQKLGTILLVADEPQIAGALGAAIIASERC
ncbi:MAG: acyl-CoA dehydratase activase [Chloroflexota bacterium]|nr:acyl-CoA dehydratase activase [Chloroflexota bacterium]